MRIVLALLARPWLWVTALRLLWRMKPDHGWLPPKEYLVFRGQVYGAPWQAIPASDVVQYLTWCRRFPRS